MKTLTISVTEEQASLLAKAVEEGKFVSDSEIIADALKLWEKREASRQAELEWLQGEVQAGIDSGPAIEVDFDKLLVELKSKRSLRG